ncbi:hypothetical protein BRD19_05285 [Halobacteriales archaeon SW_7_65_23]|nr:MAG: hypothetical protein BRD19_05285 [Halobacteriales archaeon SW_7_65_23]
MVLDQVGPGGDLLASSVLLLLFLLIPLVVGLGMVHEGFKQFRIRQRVRDTPTETPGAVAVGRTEVSGVARPAEQTCRAPFTDEECLYVQWKISERSTDADGGWELLDLGVSVSPFYVEDETGRVLVDPTRGAVSSAVVMDESSGSRRGRSTRPRPSSGPARSRPNGSPPSSATVGRWPSSPSTPSTSRRTRI